MTTTGGTIGRKITRGALGAWLLEIDMGSEIVRVATEPLAIESTELGGEVAFGGGLSDFSSQLVVDSLQVSVQAPPTRGWCEYRRALGPIRGRRFRLWRWYDGQVLEDAYLLLEGTVEAISYADPGAPDELRCTLTRNNRALSLSYPSSRMVVSADTWSLPSDSYLGEPYPTIIGAPGSRQTFSGGGVPNNTTPGLMVHFQTLDKRVLVAGHHVAAAQVHVLKRGNNGEESATIAVVNETDDLGRAVATVQTVGAGYTFTPLTDDEFVIGWDRDVAWGVGLMHRGRSVEGLGDLLIWGAEVLTTSRWDLAAMEGVRLLLNRFRIDTYWNDPIPWEDWVQRNVLGVFPVEEVSGRRGRFYRPIAYETNARQIRAVLATHGSGSGGRRVERVAPVSEGTGEIVNVVEIAYAAGNVGNTLRKRLSLGPESGKVPLYTGLAADQAGADFRAAASVGYYGERTQILEVPQVWDEATASLTAQAIIGTRALPGRSTQYLGGEDLLDLTEHATIELWDDSAGACFLGDLAIVDRITIQPDGVRVDIWSPDDPLKRPGVACEPSTEAIEFVAPPTPEFKEITVLPAGVTLDDTGSTMSAWTFAAGLWTATANGTAATGSDGFNAVGAVADLPLREIEPDWEPSTHDLWVRLQIISHTGNSDRTFSLALVETNGDEDTGHGIGFEDTATSAFGDVIGSGITTRETVAGIEEFVAVFRANDTGGRMTIFTKVSGTWEITRTYGRHDVATQTLNAAHYVLRVHSGAGATSTTGSITARISSTLVERFPLP